MEGLVETFSNISRLELSGSIHVNINQDGLITTDNPKLDKLKKNGSTLIIEGASGGGGGGNMVFNNFSGSSIGQTMINGMTITSRGSSTRIVTRSGKLIEFDDATDIIKVNGTVLGEEDKRRKKEVPESPRTTYKLIDSVIQNIIINGASTLESIHHSWINDSISVQVTGSGKVSLSNGKILSSLTAVVSGSGDVTGNGIRVNTALLSVAGSGDITGFIIIKTGSCSVAGSGDIKVSKEAGATVSKSVAGSGSILIQ